MKDTVKDMALDLSTSVKGTAITSTGLSAPFWVQYLETIINPVVAFIIALLTALYMVTKFMNGLYEWRVNWKHRMDDEREYKKKRRKGDNEVL